MVNVFNLFVCHFQLAEIIESRWLFSFQKDGTRKGMTSTDGQTPLGEKPFSLESVYWHPGSHSSLCQLYTLSTSSKFSSLQY